MRGRLRSALVADALDATGMRSQCLDPAVVSLRQGDVLLGYAFPVRIEAVVAVPAVPYQGLLAAIDSIGAGEVFVAAAEGASNVAIWGELVGTACAHRGAAGAVCDGYARDSTALRSFDFPVFCKGTVPYDSNGRSEVVAHRVSVDFGGVRVDPGDLVVADDDGVVIVPRAVSSEVVESALAKGESESQFRTAVKSGMGATEAFAKYGVL
jgi:4-hydroxy-4-methyl-2-oxoglutarate aldolase